MLKRRISLIVLIGLIIILHVKLSLAAEIVYTDQEVVVNGGFESEMAWFKDYDCAIWSYAGRDGGGLRLISDPDGSKAFAFQQVRLPTSLESAVLRFDYRAEERYEHLDRHHPISLEVFFGTSKGFVREDFLEGNEPPLTVIGTVTAETISTALDWRTFTAELDASLLEALRTAHAAGEFVFIAVSQGPAAGGDGDDCYVTSIDNFSLQVSGTQQVPEMQGRIAYGGLSAENNPKTVNIVDPNTRETVTVWAHPEEGSDYGAEVVWRPDGTEVAFTSDHERLSSVMEADIYAIRPDGSGMRKITGPSQVDIEGQDLPRVTLTGTVTNTSSLRQFIILTVQGLEDGATLGIDPMVSGAFTIQNVPVLENPDTFTQPITIRYSNDECILGVSYHVPVVPVVNGAVNLGDISLVQEYCLPVGKGYTVPSDLNWKYDGSTIYFKMLGFKSIPALDSTTFGWTSIEPDGGSFSDGFSWSPVDDRYLYVAGSFGVDYNTLYMAEEGGEPQVLVENCNDWTQPAWLQDGSGFVYIGQPDRRWSFDDNIYFYDFASGQAQRLTYFYRDDIVNLSLSPDGRHIVYERRTDGDVHYRSDFWIMDRLNPVERWRLTENGNCTHPDWSRTAPGNAFGLEITVTGQGTVSRDPDQAGYTAGAKVTLTATGSEGWRFNHWTGNVDSATAPTTTITMDSNQAVTARFVENGAGNESGGGSGGGGGCFIDTLSGQP